VVKLMISASAILFSAFVFWGFPAMADQTLHVTPAMLDNLNNLKTKLTFGPDPETMYTGVSDPAERKSAQLVFANLVDVLARDLSKHPSKVFVLQQFELALSRAPVFDTEDRERAGIYCEKIMDVLSIESSDGVLNRWLYGPVLGDMVKKK
jgi:hypothetical protein